MVLVVYWGEREREWRHTVGGEAEEDDCEKELEGAEGEGNGLVHCVFFFLLFLIFWSVPNGRWRVGKLELER